MLDTLIFDCVARTSPILSDDNKILQIDREVRNTQKTFRDSLNKEEFLILDICDVISALKSTKETKLIDKEVKRRIQMIKKQMVVPDKPGAVW